MRVLCLAGMCCTARQRSMIIASLNVTAQRLCGRVHGLIVFGVRLHILRLGEALLNLFTVNVPGQNCWRTTITCDTLDFDLLVNLERALSIALYDLQLGLTRSNCAKQFTIKY